MSERVETIYRRARGDDGVWRYLRCHTGPGDAHAEEKSSPPYYLRHIDSAGIDRWKPLRARTLAEAEVEILNDRTVVGAGKRVKRSKLANGGDSETLRELVLAIRQATDDSGHKVVPYALQIPDAAKYLGVTVWCIRCAIWNGQLPARRFGQTHVVLRSDLEQFAEEGDPVPPLNAEWIQRRRNKKVP